ncbi:MAG: Hpt domain-containing protein [Candidatus Eisenbacteria sp.]|nr:Hpt domain-containing protein [Candidatus Eisenbacteria bacterium]
MQPETPGSQIIEQMRGEFLAEAEELLDEIRADLALLGSEANRAAPDLLYKVLRAAHSLKGSSGMFGLDDLSEASHSLEGMLEDLKSGRVEDVGDFIEASLDQAEMMRSVLDEVIGAQETRPKDGDSDSAVPVQRPEASQFLRVDMGDLDQALNLVGDLFLGIDALRNLDKSVGLDGEKRSGRRERIISTRRRGRKLTELRECLLSMRMVPLARIFARLVPAVRSVTRETGKKAALTIEGGETRLDKGMAERLSDPLLHLLRNAIDHGLEEPSEREKLGKPAEGRISVSARREGSEVVIEVQDDGRGVDLGKLLEKARERGLLNGETAPSERRILDCLFAHGVTTASRVSTVSGRGVGMDVVRTNVARLSGTVAVSTEQGKGTRVSIRVPPTLSTIDGLLLEIAGQIVVLPFYSVREVIRITEADRQRVVESGNLPLRDETIRAAALAPILGLNDGVRGEEFAVVMARRSDTVAVLVDGLAERAEVLVKPLGPRLDSLDKFSGVTELADGRVAPVLDVSAVMKGVGGVEGLS